MTKLRSYPRETTRQISAALPELPAHKGGRPDLAYHVTVVRSEDRVVRTEAASALHAQLPRRVTGTELWAGIPTPAGYTHAILAGSSGAVVDLLDDSA